MDQVLLLKNLSEKYLRQKMDLYVACMNLEKVSDRDDRIALWKVLQIFVV